MKLLVHRFVLRAVPLFCNYFLCCERSRKYRRWQLIQCYTKNTTCIGYNCIVWQNNPSVSLSFFPPVSLSLSSLKILSLLSLSPSLNLILLSIHVYGPSLCKNALLKRFLSFQEIDVFVFFCVFVSLPEGIIWVDLKGNLAKLSCSLSVSCIHRNSYHSAVLIDHSFVVISYMFPKQKHFLLLFYIFVLAGLKTRSRNNNVVCVKVWSNTKNKHQHNLYLSADFLLPSAF